MPRVLALGSGMLKPKKRATADRLEQRYLNFGLLSLVSRLPSGAQMIQGIVGSPKQVVDRSRQLFEDADILLISIPSFHALSWAQELIRISSFRGRIVVGGRWVVDGNVQWLAQQVPPHVEFHEGLGEVWLETHFGRGVGQSANSTPPPQLDYMRLLDRDQYHGSIELSRGCGMHCSFCAEQNVPLTRMKNPEVVVSELMRSQRALGSSANFYFEASFFTPTQAWATTFRQAYHKRGCTSKWRAESRADSLNSRKIGELASAGLRVLDLGLESASPRQLLAMGKTKHPERYLARASETLRSCHDAGVWPKVNVMLYAGETIQTLNETRNWLDSHAEYIKGVSIYPVHFYGLDPLSGFRTLRISGAASIVPTETPGIYGVDLSKDMRYEEALSLSEDLSRRYMSAEDYFDLKSFTYFRRGYSREDFIGSLDATKAMNYPFRL